MGLAIGLQEQPSPCYWTDFRSRNGRRKRSVQERDYQTKGIEPLSRAKCTDPGHYIPYLMLCLTVSEARADLSRPLGNQEMLHEIKNMDCEVETNIGHYYREDHYMEFI